jgi:hypothetical protein
LEHQASGGDKDCCDDDNRAVSTMNEATQIGHVAKKMSP